MKHENMYEYIYSLNPIKIIWEESITEEQTKNVGGFDDFNLKFTSDSIEIEYHNKINEAMYLIFLIYESLNNETVEEGLIILNNTKIYINEDSEHKKLYKIFFDILSNSKKILYYVGKQDILYLNTNIYYKITEYKHDDYYKKLIKKTP